LDSNTEYVSSSGHGRVENEKEMKTILREEFVCQKLYSLVKESRHLYPK
jgi:hypothetical protein